MWESMRWKLNVTVTDQGSELRILSGARESTVVVLITKNKASFVFLYNES